MGCGMVLGKQVSGLSVYPAGVALGLLPGGEGRGSLPPTKRLTWLPIKFRVFRSATCLEILGYGTMLPSLRGQLSDSRHSRQSAPGP